MPSISKSNITVLNSSYLKRPWKNKGDRNALKFLNFSREHFALLLLFSVIHTEVAANPQISGLICKPNKEEMN